MKASTRPVRTRSITTHSTLLPRWDTTPFQHMGTVSPTIDPRTLPLLYLLCILTRSRLLSTSPPTSLEPPIRRLDDSPSCRLISPSARTLPPVPPLVPQLGALVRYVVFIVNVVVGTTLLFSLTDHPIAFVDLTPRPSVFCATYPILICSIYLLISRRAQKACAADPLCFYFPLSIRFQVRSPCYFTVLLISLLTPSAHIRTPLSFSLPTPTLTTTRYDDILPSPFLWFEMSHLGCPFFFLYQIAYCSYTLHYI